jgi:hypothetical protein
LKALFIGRPIYQIEGVDKRANSSLAKSMSDLAHERWAAGRWVSPELWRSCQGELSDQIVEDLKRLVSTGEPGQREAAALMVAGSEAAGDERLKTVCEEIPVLIEDVKSGKLDWDYLGLEFGKAQFSVFDDKQDEVLQQSDE